MQLYVMWFVETLLLAGMLSWLPVMRGAAGFFGVNVSPDYLAQTGRVLLRAYRRRLLITLLALTAVGMGLAWATSTTWQNGRLMTPFGVTMTLNLLAAAIVYRQAARAARPHAIAGATRVAASMRTRRLRDFTFPGYEALLVALTLAPFAVLWFYYDLLPPRVPTHYDFAGRPDAWRGKTWQTVFATPLISLWMQGLLLIAKYSFIGMRITLPVDRSEEYRALKEQALGLWIRGADGARALLGLMLSALAMNVAFSSVPALSAWRPVAMVTVWFVTIALIAGLAWALWQTLRLNAQMEQIAGAAFVTSAMEERGWRAGGLIYYNPADPALFVEKRIGLGATVNFGHKSVWWLLAYMALGLALSFIFTIAA
ncbi:MAG: DUF1648 domain-containing protein [Blastocatellia bacterium]